MMACWSAGMGPPMKGYFIGSRRCVGDVVIRAVLGDRIARIGWPLITDWRDYGGMRRAAREPDDLLVSIVEDDSDCMSLPRA